SSAADALLVPLAIAAQMSTAAIVIAIAMAAARRLPRGWWLVAPVVVAVLQGGFLLAAPSLDEGPALDDPVLLADAHELARPLSTAVARRYEAEADWMALQATRDPHAMVVLMQEIDVEHHAAPTRPWWALALFEDHPDIMHRIDMAVAWQTRAG